MFNNPIFLYICVTKNLSMKLGLIGYGKMGKAIEQIAIDRGHSVDLIIDINNPEDLNPENLKNIDVVIEFTVPSSAINNIYKCFEGNTPIVCGTTGWLDQLQEVKTKMESHNGGLFYASNFSLGVNLFFELNKKLAQLMNPFSEYESSVEETHHIQKLDAPSGTALTIAEDMLELLDGKKQWTLAEQKNADDLVVNPIRRGLVPGTHIVRYESIVDEISIKHEAKSRQGFALGAVLASEYMCGKSGVHGMKDLLNL
jgi:4-hydroxy-tetrahydrodipicolinate reductase